MIHGENPILTPCAQENEAEGDHRGRGGGLPAESAPYAYGENLDHERRIDYAKDGIPIGVELLCVSEGVITDDLPSQREIERLLGDRGIKVYA